MPQEAEAFGFCAAAGGEPVTSRLPSWGCTLREEMGWVKALVSTSSKVCKGRNLGTRNVSRIGSSFGGENGKAGGSVRNLSTHLDILRNCLTPPPLLRLIKYRAHAQSK